jgi:signal peptidase I
MTVMSQESPADSPEAPKQEHHSSDWSRSLRETIESIAIAFALAFLFKTFEAEAFVIPTGSMTPTLMGRHKDVVCPQCGNRYSASGSEEADRDGNLRRLPTGEVDERWTVIECTCPNCRFPMSVDPRETDAGGAEHPSYSGDRIWVSKVPYHFAEPRRWDVLVFRFPLEAETYYIKRLVGLPNETVRNSHGDVYAKGLKDAEFSLARKPPEKLRAMAQVVYDADHVSPALLEAGWPARWRGTGDGAEAGAWQATEDTRTYELDGTAKGTAWLRYEHTVPPESFWRARAAKGTPLRVEPRAELITDFYAFNTRVLRGEYGTTPSMLGLHWVGDLILDSTVDVRGDKGSLLLDLVKGGRHFRATIDVATGKAVLSIDGVPDWHPTAQTKVRGPGEHRLMFANVDRQLTLWVDDNVVEFDAPTTYDDLGNDRPRSSAQDRGDLSPLGIGSEGVALCVKHLRVLRDIYYIADRSLDRVPITDFRARTSMVPLFRPEELVEFLSTPGSWDRGNGTSAFDDRQEIDIELGRDQ